MKIKKYSDVLLESKLMEDSEPEVIDTSDSIATIADDVADSIEAGSDGELEISDADATKIAGEVKAAGDELGVTAAAVDLPDEFEALGVENIITKTLDLALAGALKTKRRKGKFGNNVLIVGLPGSGKTASVYDWAYSRGINLVSLNAKNNDLDAYINGYTTKNPDNPRKVTQAFSDNLAALEEPRSVLFLDEYNRQVKPHIRASLYTLINEHKIVGEGPNNQHEFKNMLFTIAAINPAVDTDRGAAKLNDAEKTRFLYKLKDMDSDPATTIEYLSKYFTKRIGELNTEDESYLEDVEDYARCLDLGIFILSHPKFAYDTKADLDALDDEDLTMLNQRTFVEGLVSCDGRVEAFKLWTEHSSDFLERDIDMLLSIMREYVEPDLETLCLSHGIDLSTGTVKPDESKITTDKPTEEEPESTIEDDDDFYTTSGVEGAVRAKNPYEVEMAINSALKDW